MDFTNILEKLMLGDVRTFVTIAMIALCFFVVFRYLERVTYSYRGFIKLLAVMVIGFGVYVWVVNPDLFTQKMNGLIDWTTERIEPLFTDDESNDYLN